MSTSVGQSTPRARGNAFFTARDFAAAAAAYSEGLRSSTHTPSQRLTRTESEEQALLLSNRAACHLELGNAVAAAADCKACLQLHPCNYKAHYRLARALQPDDESAGPAIAAALALCPPADHTPPMLETYAAIQRATAAAGDALLLQLPHDVGRLACAADWDGVTSALWRGAGLVVLRPGTYKTYTDLPRARGGGAYTLLGLGRVELHTLGSHAVWVTEKHTAAVTLAGVRLMGSGRAAAACVSGSGAQLQLVGCRVEDYGEAGLLVCDGAVARLYRCTFTKTAAQAVEVREGGQLEANHLTVTDCSQGVSAYGGARSVLLRNSTILRCKQEGVLAAGTYTNAATEAQNGDRGPSRSARAREVTEAAEARGRQQGTQLEVSLLSCTISQCGQFGVSADYGASVVAQGCRLERNDPYAFFIKGGSDVSVLACQVVYADAVSKSPWWARNRGPGVPKNPRQAGVQVGINYGGSVNVVGSAFAGREEMAIVEEIKAVSGGTSVIVRKMGLWSKPAKAERNSFHGGGGLPSMEALARRLPSWMLLMGDDRGAGGALLSDSGPQRRAAASPPPALLQRISRTFPQSAWAPTANEFYAIGNTLGYDVTGGAAPQQTAGGPAVVRVLLGACGDVRNLLATAHVVLPQPPGPHGSGGSRRRLEFTLNDGNLAMLARNAVLLHMAAELRAPPEAVLAVWASHGLTAQHAELLARSLQALARDPWPAWLRAAASLDDDGDDVTEAAAAAQSAGEGDEGDEREGGAVRADAEGVLRGAFAAWSSCTLSLEELLKQREEWLAGGSISSAGGLRSTSVELSMGAVRSSMGAAVAEKLRDEVAEYVRTGSLQPEAGGSPLVATNLTFLLAPELQYTVYFSSSIFRAVPLGPGKSASSRLLATLAPQLAATAEALRSGCATVKLVPRDILATLTSSPPTPPPAGPADSPARPAAQGRPPENNEFMDFDFIDCSNVADYVSLQALVQAAAPRLAYRPHSRLRTESIVLFSRELVDQPTLTPGRFVEGQLGPSLPAFQELLGVRLVAGEVVAGPQSCMRLEWMVDLQQAEAEGEESGVEAHAGRNGSSSSGSGGRGGSSRSSWMTAPRLLMELLPACKHFLSGGVAGCNGAPLALVHLLTLAAPHQAVALLGALLRCDSSGHAALFKWELTMHAQLQAGRRPVVQRASYNAKPGFDLAMRQGHDKPLLLAFSRGPLPRGPVAVTGGQVKQLMSAFAWDEDLAKAHVLLPESIIEQCGTWYVTLCVAEDSNKAGAGAELVVVGASARVASLTLHPAVGQAAAPVRWMALGRPPLQMDMTLVDRVGTSRPPAGAAAVQQDRNQQQQWQGVVHECRGGRSLTVDVLAPGPLPPPEEAAVVVSVEAGVCSVSVKPKSTRGGSAGLADEEFKLPAAGVYSKPEAVKLSRKLGLLSARVELLASS